MNNKLKRKKNTQKNEPIMLFAVWRYWINFDSTPISGTDISKLFGKDILTKVPKLKPLLLITALLSATSIISKSEALCLIFSPLIHP